MLIITKVPLASNIKERKGGQKMEILEQFFNQKYFSSSLFLDNMGFD